jgi:type IV secretion system protein VirD4
MSLQLPRRTAKPRFDPRQVGWQIGKASEPRAGALWCPWDRTAGVIGPQGSGKTLDLLTPALLDAPGGALVTLTKLDDLLLTVGARSAGGRPVCVLDPFGLAPGLPELVWDPIAGCVDPMVAERRAKAFTAGNIRSSHDGDGAARFYAAEAAKVLGCYLHAAALTGQTLDAVLAWVAHPHGTSEPLEVLREHPHAARFWAGLLNGALSGDDRTAGNTIVTVQQAMALFFQPDLRARCVPNSSRPATDVADIIRRGGTIYLLGREDPYASASPLMTAVAEYVLDTALALANASPWGRLCPPMLASLDELPSTAPLPTLRTRMANERALGLSFIYAAQTWRQLATVYGEQDARALLGLTNVLVLFGGSKDVAFNKEISDLIGTVRVSRTTWQHGKNGGRTTTGEDIPILRPEEVRQLPEKHALVVPENGRPILAKLHRCIEGRPGRALLAEQAAARDQVASARGQRLTDTARTDAALAAARRAALVDQLREG